jgi:hypothetical protein
LSETKPDLSRSVHTEVGRRAGDASAANSTAPDEPGPCGARNLPSRIAAGIRTTSTNLLQRAEGRSHGPLTPAAPGVLLAGEIAKRAMGASTALSPSANTLYTNILSGPHRNWLLRRSKRAGCTCTDETYRAFYRKRWSTRQADASASTSF